MRTVRLGDVCELKPRKSIAKSLLSVDDEVSFAPMDQLPIGLKYFSPKENRQMKHVYSSYVYFEDNDLIYAKITPCFENGKMAIAKNLNNGIGFGSSEFVPIRCSDEILPEYLYYFLLSPSFISDGKLKMTGASGHRRLPDNFTEDLLIPLPSVNEQRRVVARLDAAFEKIDRAIELTHKNYEKAKQLFDSELAKQFRDRDWNMASLEENVRFIDYRGRTPKKTPSGMRLITAKNIKLGRLELEPKEFVDPAIYDSWMVRGIPRKDDVLFTTEAPLANVAQLDTDERVVFAQRCIILQPDSDKLRPKFLKYMLLSDPIRSTILAHATGTTVSGIRSSLLKKINIYIPSVDVQDNISERLSIVELKASELALRCESKVALLKLLKQSMLAQTFSDKVGS